MLSSSLPMMKNAQVASVPTRALPATPKRGTWVLLWTAVTIVGTVQSEFATCIVTDHVAITNTL